MRKLLKLVPILALAFVGLGSVPLFAQVTNPGLNRPSAQSYVAGRFVARNYLYTGIQVIAGSSAAGGSTAGTLSLRNATVALPDGRNIMPFGGGFNIAGQPAAIPFAPITVGAGVTKETVTPTAVSGCYNQAPQGSCTLSATFTNAHGNGDIVQSGSCGIQEAIIDAAYFGGGVVEVDGSLNQVCGGSGAVTAFVAAATVLPNVTIEDTHLGVTQFWTPSGNATVQTAPSTLTATTVGFGLNGANTTAGTYTGSSTYHVCIAYVDIMGNESPCSADFSGLTAGSGTTNQIGFSAPAAATGMVGYVQNISLGGGTYALAYRVPVATYSQGIATSNGVCTLTTLETKIAACAIANTAYGQAASNAVVSALTVNTARIWIGLGGTSTTGDQVGNSNARTAYNYVSGSRVGIPGFESSSQAFTAQANGGASTAPAVLGTIEVPPGAMNAVGKKIRVCGNLTAGGGSTATIIQIEFYWDADGSDVTGSGVILPGPKITSTVSATPAYQFCQDLITTVAGTGATAGSIQSTDGYITQALSTASTAAANFFTAQTLVAAAVGGLNLAQEARLHVTMLHTTGTDAAYTLNSLTIAAVN